MGLGGHKDLHRALAKDLMIHIVGCVTIFNHLEPKFETLPIETDNLSLGQMHATMSKEKNQISETKSFAVRDVRLCTVTICEQKCFSLVKYSPGILGKVIFEILFFFCNIKICTSICYLRMGFIDSPWGL